MGTLMPISHVRGKTVTAPCGREANKEESKKSKPVIAGMLVAGLIAMCAPVATMAAEDGAWESGLALGFGLTDGNSETTTLSLDLEANRAWDSNEFLSGIKFGYGETDSETTREDVKADAQYNRLYTERNYAYLNASGLYDDIAQVDYRFLVGPGLGRHFVMTDTTRLSAEAGVSYLAEDQGGVTKSTAVLRIAERFERALSETSKVWQNLEYAPEIDDFESYAINGEIGAQAAMNSTLSLRVVLEDRYNDDPAVGSERNDLIVSAAAVYTL